jgi:hypothetical protein
LSDYIWGLQYAIRFDSVCSLRKNIPGAQLGLCRFDLYMFKELVQEMKLTQKRNYKSASKKDGCDRSFCCDVFQHVLVFKPLWTMRIPPGWWRANIGSGVHFLYLEVERIPLREPERRRYNQYHLTCRVSSYNSRCHASLLLPYSHRYPNLNAPH